MVIVAFILTFIIGVECQFILTCWWFRWGHCQLFKHWFIIDIPIDRIIVTHCLIISLKNNFTIFSHPCVVIKLPYSCLNWKLHWQPLYPHRNFLFALQLLPSKPCSKHLPGHHLVRTQDSLSMSLGKPCDLISYDKNENLCDKQLITSHCLTIHT